MVVSYAPQSPYYQTQQTNFSLEVWTKRNIPALNNDSLITLDPVYENKPDLLSYDLYGDVRYWWVFAVRNPNLIKDPIYDMKPGLQIYVTDKNTLLDLLNA